MVYVDDFKLASLKEHTQTIRKDIRSDLELSELEAPDRFLGCYLSVTTEPISQVQEFLHTHPRFIQKVDGIVSRLPFDQDLDATVNVISYNVEKFLSSAVDKYCSGVCRDRKGLRKAPTPFTDESKEPQGFVRPPTKLEKEAEAKGDPDFYEQEVDSEAPSGTEGHESTPGKAAPARSGMNGQGKTDRSAASARPGMDDQSKSNHNAARGGISSGPLFEKETRS